jgi:hypothetical protein
MKVNNKISDIAVDAISAIVSPRKYDITDVTKKIMLNNRF